MLGKLLDYYFRNTIAFDIIIGLLICSMYLWVNNEGILVLPNEDYVKNITSETVTILLTIIGFVLTFLSIIITFKEGKSEYNNTDTTNVQTIFYKSRLYFETIKHIKNTIKSLMTSAIAIYLTRFIFFNNLKFIYLAALFGISILIISVVKSLFIINKVIEFQSQKSKL